MYPPIYPAVCPCASNTPVCPLYTCMSFSRVLLILVPSFVPYLYRGGALGRRRVSTLL